MPLNFIKPMNLLNLIMQGKQAIGMILNSYDYRYINSWVKHVIINYR